MYLIELVATNNIYSMFKRCLIDTLFKSRKTSKKIKEKKEYRFECCKDIHELASRLLILCELDLQYATELGVAEHILRDLETLKNDAE